MKYLYETSWEVCNKVGGIYTVIRTKSKEAVKHFGENYFTLGPLLQNNPGFSETNEPLWEKLQPAFKEKGLECSLGRWDIPGKPRTILVDFKGRHNTSNLLYNLWKDFGIDSFSGQSDYIESVYFSTTCAEIIEVIHNTLYQEGDESVAHFHEWMSGAGLLYVKKHIPEIGTVFTTHATVLGRYLSENNIQVQSDLGGKNPQDEARNFNVTARHSVESASAREADCFTTISDITADESKAVLNKYPDLVINNGLNIKDILEISDSKKIRLHNRKHLQMLCRKILQKDIIPDTKFILISGRYEFHNKGIDVFLEALANLEKNISEDKSIPPVVAFVLLARGHGGVSKEIQDRIKDDTSGLDKPAALATHIIDERNDAVVNSCHRLGLRNLHHNKVNVIFSTAYLDGKDGVFNIPYYDIASACDLGVFPSFYEPWGYTSLECAAHAVPVLTTDLTGFGKWANDLSHSPGKAITVLKRRNRKENSFIADFTRALLDFFKLNETELDTMRKQARQIAQMADWRVFYQRYLSAYHKAFSKAAKRSNLLDTSSFSDNLFTSFSGEGASSPHYRFFASPPSLPKELSELREIAHNLWWVWHAEAQEMFKNIDPDLWRDLNHNPVDLLHKVANETFKQKTEDTKFMNLYKSVVRKFQQYMDSKASYNEATSDINSSMPIAYFSMEYGFHESMPIYSGGLGLLSGDHLKSASDLNLPFVGVGLLYKHGYFKQNIDLDGMQRESYPMLEFSQLPIRSLLDENEDEMHVSVKMPGRSVKARIWWVAVGRVKLYLLDTDIQENSPDDRKITAQLYGGDKDHRLKQEIVLGFGGLILLREKLNIKPSVFHINEGHAAFLMIKRIKRFMGVVGLNYQEAREAVKASSIFTTHTPVPAGNETFDVNLLKYYLADFIKELKVPWEEFLEFGWEKPGDDRAEFSMTVLALKMTSKANGVAKLHGKIARKMWLEVWSGVNEEEIPISSVTNGVHLSTWIGEEMRLLLEKYIAVEWDKDCGKKEIWQKIDDIPEKAVWDAHMIQKKKVFEEIKRRISLEYKCRGEDPQLLKEILEKLDHKCFTIAFARRFATYKRGGLIFKDLERFIKMANDSKKPIQLLIAGKSHPADQAGKDVIKWIYDLSRSKELRGKVIFLENYDIAVARLLVQGVDLWLNNPIRPHEASGTSGMKAGANGVINFSILDGWWDEAFSPEIGWAIDPGVSYANQEQQDRIDNLAMMDTLEREIVPLYYQENSKGFSPEWEKIMKGSLREVSSYFNSTRMVKEYYDHFYLPVAKREAKLYENDYSDIKELTSWKKRIRARFSTINIQNIIVKGIKGDVLIPDAPLEIDLWVDPGKMGPKELKAELVIGLNEKDQSSKNLQAIPFIQINSETGSILLKFNISYKVKQSGNYFYGIRIVPFHKLLSSIQETGLAYWG